MAYSRTLARWQPYRYASTCIFPLTLHLASQVIKIRHGMDKMCVRLDC